MATYVSQATYNTGTPTQQAQWKVDTSISSPSPSPSPPPTISTPSPPPSNQGGAVYTTATASQTGVNIGQTGGAPSANLEYQPGGKVMAQVQAIGLPPGFTGNIYPSVLATFPAAIRPLRSIENSNPKTGGGIISRLQLPRIGSIPIRYQPKVRAD